MELNFTINFQDFPHAEFKEADLLSVLSLVISYLFSQNSSILGSVLKRFPTCFHTHTWKKNKQFLLGLVTIKWCGQLYGGMCLSRCVTAVPLAFGAVSLDSCLS